jgi:ATP-binding cassette subfamily F protein 3
MTLLIQAADIRYAYGGHEIFADASFEVRQGDRLALMGANGAGKSTLFSIMARRLVPDSGVVTHRGGLTVGYLQQEPDLDPGQTVRDVIALAVGEPAALEAHLRSLEARLGDPLDDDEMIAVMDAYSETLTRLERPTETTDAERGTAALTGLRLPKERWDTPTGMLSGGEKKLLALAKLLVEQPDVMLLDEPDNHLDLEAKGWLEEVIRGHPGSVALISHDRYLIDRVANQIFELVDGRVETYPGNYSQFVEERQRRLGRQAQLRDLQLREFKKLKASAEQLTQWARQNPKFAPRAENQRRKLAEERERLAQSPALVLNRRRIAVEFDADRGSSLVLEARGLAKAYGTREVFLPFDLTIRQGEAVGLVGANGSGKTTLFRMILGEEKPSAGRLRIGPACVVGYYAQEHETLDPTQTPLDLVRTLKPLTEQQAISFLGTLLLDRDDAHTKIGNLSGGERARLQVGALMLGGANFLLLDEPTNNLDIASIDVLESALLEFPGSILTISHDRYFLDKVCTRTIALDGGVVRDFPGGFSLYQEHPEVGVELTSRTAGPPAKRLAHG